MNPNAHDTTPAVRTERASNGNWYGMDERGNILVIATTERAARIGAEFKLDKRLARQSKYDGAVR